MRSFPVLITNCEECPYKIYGLRKCGELEKWFGNFEIETGIPEWCPKCNDRLPEEVIEEFRKYAKSMMEGVPMFIALGLMPHTSKYLKEHYKEVEAR
jgi:hypothetical protein